MNSGKRTRLKKAGWKIGSADEFLGLTDAESKLVSIRLALAARLKHQRLANGLSQQVLARRLGSSQSRVAKMEAAAPSVTADLLIRAMLVTGADPKTIGDAITAAKP